MVTTIDPRFRHAGIAGGPRRKAERADLVAEPRAPDQQPDAEGGAQRHEQRHVQRRPTQRGAEEIEQPAEPRQLRTRRESARARLHGADRFEHRDQQIDHQAGGDEVEHDRGDDDVAAALRLQIRRDQRPERAEKEGEADRQRQVQPPGQHCAKRQGDDGDAETTEIGLPLAADVEQPAMESDGDGEPGEDEVRRVIEREADALAIAERALDHQPRRLDRAFADDQHDEPGDEEGDDEIDQRDHPEIDPDRQLGIGTAHMRLTGSASGLRPVGLARVRLARAAFPDRYGLARRDARTDCARPPTNGRRDLGNCRNSHPRTLLRAA